MNVQELMRELKKLDPNANVYFRRKSSIYSVTIVRYNPHTTFIVELTNQECLPI